MYISGYVGLIEDESLGFRFIIVESLETAEIKTKKAMRALLIAVLEKEVKEFSTGYFGEGWADMKVEVLFERLRRGLNVLNFGTRMRAAYEQLAAETYEVLAWCEKRTA